MYNFLDPRVKACPGFDTRLEDDEISMTNFLNTLNSALQSIVDNLPLLLAIIAGFWLIHFINFLLKYRLNYLGIIPREPATLLGIIFSPFLHVNAAHLMMNSVMLFALSGVILMDGREVYFSASGCIILLSGLLIWLFARPGLHVGASALVMGYFAFVLVNGISHPSLITIAVAIICLYYFGGLFINLFPQEKRVSWEGHVFGFIAGIVTSFLI